ncbi:hypothetical protein AciPR4_1392 [Terriglobus saanensis SP1PR4]|uniref:Uncharacterized protein n=1 Tax=Terriglobus saanensis (strain ATCC BAA-1853 / DSM 23119 / SP1PR4) TaxID=401053 RepID=E8V060_TERSS|nr:hypothetical protein AciPR4_1392 [Terriglobus saanensis SP1PR4]
MGAGHRLMKTPLKIDLRLREFAQYLAHNQGYLTQICGAKVFLWK